MDTAIVSAVRRAARKIEQNRTYQYMKKFGSFAFDLTASSPWIIDTPNEFKAIKLIRLNVDGEYYRIPRGLNVEQLNLPDGKPLHYELDGTSRLIFDANPDTAYTVEVFFDMYTSWPTEDTATNWLITNGEEALYFEALLSLSATTRDPRQRANLQALRDEALRSLLIADEEMQSSDYTSAMTFTPEGGLDDQH